MEVTVINGNNVLVNGMNDCVDYIAEHMGYDFAQTVFGIYNGGAEDLKQEKEALRYEMRGYEFSCEEYHRMLRDTVEELESVIKYVVESKRIDRNKLSKSVKSIKDSIWNNI